METSILNSNLKIPFFDLFDAKDFQRILPKMIFYIQIVSEDSFRIVDLNYSLSSWNLKESFLFYFSNKWKHILHFYSAHKIGEKLKCNYLLK